MTIKPRGEAWLVTPWRGDLVTYSEAGQLADPPDVLLSPSYLLLYSLCSPRPTCEQDTVLIREY